MFDEDILAIQACYPQIYLACHTRHVRAASSATGLSPQDSTILAHLSEISPATAGELAAHLGVQASTLSAAIKRLGSLGYITRIADEHDRRVARLTLASAGVAAMQESSVLESARVEKVLRRLTPAERETAKAGLQLLARASREVMAAEKRKKRREK